MLSNSSHLEAALDEQDRSEVIAENDDTDTEDSQYEEEEEEESKVIKGVKEGMRKKIGTNGL